MSAIHSPRLHLSRSQQIQLSWWSHQVIWGEKNVNSTFVIRLLAIRAKHSINALQAFRTTIHFSLRIISNQQKPAQFRFCARINLLSLKEEIQESKFVMTLVL